MTADARPATRSRGIAFDVFRPIWRLLTSVRFAVFYIGALAFFGLLGVLIPQVPEAMRGNGPAINVWLDTQRGRFGPLTDTMYRLGLFEVFHAKWFLFALGFLVVNVTVCTFNRWAPTFRNVFRPPVRVPESFYDNAHNRAVLAPVDAGRLETTLHRMRFRTVTERRDGATYVFADRYPWAQLATFVSHLALIIFIAGGLVTWFTGFEADIFTGTGTTAPVFAVSNPNQLQVRVDDAVGRYGPNGNPLDFRTQITIFKNGQEVASGTTTVNDPFKYGGYRFHQVAYFPDGAELKIRDVATGNTVFHETFPLDQTTPAPGVTITDSSGNVLLSRVLAPTDFLDIASGGLVAVPDSGRTLWIGLTTQDGRAWQLAAYDPSGQGISGQARIALGQSATVSGLGVRFDRVVAVPSAVGVDVPGSDQPALAQLAPAGDGSSTLLLTGKNRAPLDLAPGQSATMGGLEYTFVAQRAFAGIAVKRDSGAWFIWIATAMLLLGLALTFYVPRRRLWIRLDDSGTRVAALAEKRGGFESELRALARRMDIPVPPELEEER